MTKILDNRKVGDYPNSFSFIMKTENMGSLLYQDFEIEADNDMEEK